ncbi:hypothetical protein LPB86_01395 [Pedobacter sp. MC2016-14]|uniref:hypothetical protein n=1 Tax=Pedobacter sp. MC2016-14 TaxID=2897327 RepID=UPI001E2DD735|nr:hypothetical protein [Pedobacter sp. MC2016-14]MCD0486863.1 hypothetical protein [Pedobacter sp. MC2016-14]
MKIAFLCGSLEPGRDGVGDYVRRLGGELAESGHQILAVALNDGFVEKATYEDNNDRSSNLRLIRIPTNSIDDKNEMMMVSNSIKEFDPNVISLQYVPYAFDLKGLPFNLAKKLKGVIQGKSLHIMFHELWLDMPVSWSQRIVAIAQKALIYNFIRILKPAYCSVSIPFNQKRLKGLGVQSEVLNLFGNIYKNDTEHLLNPKGIDFNVPSIFYFGTAPKGEFLQKLLKEISRLREKISGNIQVIVACGNSHDKDIFYNELKTILSDKDKVIDCGFLEVEAVSELMSNCTVGISRSSVRLLGKSGSAIAMLEHGLPLWMPKWDGMEKLDLGFRENLIYSDLYTALQAKRETHYHSLLPGVAELFIKSLAQLKQ